MSISFILIERKLKLTSIHCSMVDNLVDMDYCGACSWYAWCQSMTSIKCVHGVRGSACVFQSMTCMRRVAWGLLECVGCKRGVRLMAWRQLPVPTYLHLPTLTLLYLPTYTFLPCVTFLSFFPCFLNFIRHAFLSYSYLILLRRRRDSFPTYLPSYTYISLTALLFVAQLSYRYVLISMYGSYATGLGCWQSMYVLLCVYCDCMIIILIVMQDGCCWVRTRR